MSLIICNRLNIGCNTLDEYTLLLENSLSKMSLPASREILEQFATFHNLLKSWNTKVNLTTVVTWEQAVERHYLDSAAVTLAYSFKKKSEDQRTKVLDVGSGGGFPGVPLKILFPDICLTLLDSVRKKTVFLEKATALLGLEPVEILGQRAESAANEQQHRQAYDLVVARAVAELRVLAELTLPFCKIGGTVVAIKGENISSELENSFGAIAKLGGKISAIIDCSNKFEFLKSNLVVISKIAETPSRFPRRPGIPSKRPIMRDT